MTLRSVLSRAQQAVSVLTVRPFDSGTAAGRSRERYRRVALSGASSVLAKAVMTLTLLVSIPLTLHYLGQERFGVWAVLSTVIAFLALTDLGVGNALVNAVAAAAGKENRTAAQEAVSTAFFILASMGIVLVLSLIVLRHWLDWREVFNVQSDLARSEVGAALGVLVALAALQLPFSAVQRVQEGFQEGYATNLWQAAAAGAGLAGLVIVVYLGLGLPWLVAAVAGAPVLGAILNSAQQYFYLRPWLRPRVRAVSAAASRDLVRSGFTFLCLALLTFLGIYSDNLIISSMFGPSAVAEYAVVQRLSLIAHLFWALITPLWPAYGEAMSRGEYDWIRRTFQRAVAGSSAAGLLFGAGLAIFGYDVIRLWIGGDVEVQPAVIYGFACYIALSGLIGSVATLMNSGPLVRTQLWLLALAASASLTLKIVLGIRYGVAGVIWATVFGFSLFYVFPGVWMIWRLTDRAFHDRHSR